MQIRLERTRLNQLFVTCVFCGNAIRGGSHEVIGILEFEDEDATLEHGPDVFVCRHCVAAGAAGVRQHLSDRAARLRAEAEHYDRLAMGPISMPTREEWDHLANITSSA
jgi:hypothetical protein